MRQQYLQQQQQQQQMMAQPTGYGSNNPFAPGGSQYQPPQQQQSPQPTSSFLPVPQVSSPQPPQQQIEPQQTARPFQPAVQKDDGQHSHLAGLLAKGREDGMDTFGNTGNLRKLPCRLCSLPCSHAQVSPSAPASTARIEWRSSRPARGRTKPASGRTILLVKLASSRSPLTSLSSPSDRAVRFAPVRIPDTRSIDARRCMSISTMW